MKPKEKSFFDEIIFAVLLIAILFVALHGAMAYFDTELLRSTLDDYDVKRKAIADFLFNFEKSFQTPFDIRFTPYTLKTLFYSFVAWLIAALYYFTTRKNYIHGIEFGTARWGKLSDISPMFATNILKKEIKRIKRSGKLLYKMKQLKKDRAEVHKAYENDRANLYTRYKRGFVEKREYEEACAILDNGESARMEELRAATRLTMKQRRQKIYKLEDKYKNADMLFTATERISLYNHVVNNNTLIIAGSGGGKTRNFAVPNILQAHSSFVITDPKGEILEKTGYFLEKIKGYKIHVLNLDAKAESDGYNPFEYVHPEREGVEERIMLLIDTIILNTDGGEKKSSSDPFWDRGEKLFLQSVFFFTVFGFVKEEQNMNTVMKLIRMLKIEEERDKRNSDLDIFAELFKDVVPDGEENIGYQQYMEFRSKAAGKTAKSIVITAVARLAPFRVAEIRRILSYDNMKLDRVGEEKTAIFVVTPPTDSTYNFIAGMLFTQLFQEIQYSALQVHKHDGQRLPVPCRFLLDEFANVCEIPNFKKLLAYARSLGVGIVTILQSLDQIKEMYKDDWGVIVDNSNTLLYLGNVTHVDTLKYLSELLGKGTFDKRTTGRSRGRMGSSSQNFDVVGRELMTEAEIREMPKTDCLFLVSGKPPFYSKKYDYPSHPNYRFTSDGGAESYHYVPYVPNKFNHGDDGHNSHSPYDEELKNLSAPPKATVITDKRVLLEKLQRSATHCGFSNIEVNDGEGWSSEQEAFLREIYNQKNTELLRTQKQSAAATHSLELEQLEREIIKIHNGEYLSTGWQLFEPAIDLLKLAADGKNAVAFSDITVDDGETQSDITVEEFAEILESEDDKDTLKQYINEFGKLDLHELSNDPAITVILNDIIENQEGDKSNEK